jgi:hypothetical protein
MLLSIRTAYLTLAAIAVCAVFARAADSSKSEQERPDGSQSVSLFDLSFAKTDQRLSDTASLEPSLPSRESLVAQNPDPQANLSDPAQFSFAYSPPPEQPGTRLYESSWYTRIEYFQWQETLEGERFMQNEGVAPTVGWQQRYGRQRYRFDFFGARPDYVAPIDGEVVDNVTDYLGLRGEYELLWEPQTFGNHSLFVGVGSRFFVRSIPDVIVNNNLYFGYQEAWWTFYPYLGIERRRTLRGDFELYSMIRVGMTAFTREHITHGDVTLFPRPGVTYQSELGVRGPRLSVACFSELMAWSISPQVLNYEDDQLFYVRQPQSTLLTIGGRVSWSY